MKPKDYIKNNLCMIKVGQPMVLTLIDGTIVKGKFVARRTTSLHSPQWALIDRVSPGNEKVHYIYEEEIEDVRLEPYGKPVLIVKQSNLKNSV